MNKRELATELQSRLDGNYTQAEAVDVIDAVLETLKACLERGEEIKLRGFGSFTTKSYEAREARNPRTGETVTVPPKRVARFKQYPSFDLSV